MAEGVWRTIKGRRVFIAEGEDLYTAMKKSGKFKNLKKKVDYDKRPISDVDKENEYNNKRIQKIDEGQKTFDPVAFENWRKEYDPNFSMDDDKLRYIYEIEGQPKSMKEYLKVDKEWNTLANKMEKDYDEFGTFNYNDEKKLNQLSTKRDNLQYKIRANKPAKIKNRKTKLSDKDIKSVKSQKALKQLIEEGKVTDITRYSDEENRKLTKKHGRLEAVKVVHGVYGMNAALLRSRTTGEYYGITSRNSNLFFHI